VIINPGDQSSIQEKFSLVQKAFWYDTRQKKVQGKCSRTTKTCFLWWGVSEGKRHDAFQMIQDASSQENSSSSKQLKASSFIVFALRHVLFNTHFCIRLITYLFCTGHLLQNSLTEILICHWTASNVVGPECSNLVEDASNVFACPGVDDRAVTYTLPADLISAIIKRFSFEGNWILDLTRSKGTFTTYTVRTQNLVTCQHTVNRQPRISNKRN